MIGATTDEGLLLYQGVRENPEFYISPAGFEAIIPTSHFVCTAGDERSRQIACEIQHRYFGESVPNAENALSVLEMWGDACFWHNVQQSVRARLADDRRTTAPTYLYRYACKSSGRFAWKKEQYVGVGVPGAAHADEVHYLFKCAYLTETLPDDCAEMRRVRQMVGMWTQFAATGNPNCAEMDGMADEACEWQPVQKSKSADRTVPFKCLEIGDTQLRFVDLPETERIAIWEELYAKYYTAD